MCGSCPIACQTVLLSDWRIRRLREQERVAVPSTMTNPIRLHVDSTCHTAAQLSTGPVCTAPIYTGMARLTVFVVSGNAMR